MKKILLLLLVSFIAKPDYSGVGLTFATQGDADIVGLSYGSVTSKLGVDVSYGRAEVGSISGNVYGVGLAYGFTDFNTGSFYVDVGYTRVDVLGVSVSDTDFGLGYAKSSGDGLDYNVGISDSDAGSVLSADVTNWYGNLGIGAGIAADDNDTAYSVSFIYKF